MKRHLKLCILLLVLSAVALLHSQKLKPVIYRNGDHFYVYKRQRYKNDGEFFLTEKEMEYVELIKEFPDGVEGAELYNRLYRYADWLLLSIDGERYFLLLRKSEKSRADHARPAGTPGLIYYDGELYCNMVDEMPEGALENMEAVGFIQSFVDTDPCSEFQANTSEYLGHLLFQYEDMLMISGGSGDYDVYMLWQGGTNCDRVICSM